MDDWLFGVCSLLRTPRGIAAMPREDKPFCGVSWWWGSACYGSGGFLIRELWRWQGPSLLSVQPSRETFSVGFNSRLTSLSASGVRRQTCKDLVQKQRLWNKSFSHYKTTGNQPPLHYFYVAFLFMRFDTASCCIVVSLHTFCCELMLYTI